MAFKDRLKHLRNERGITQEDLAKALDVPSSTIRRYESSNNMPKTERLQAIADFFGRTVDFLLEREEGNTEHNRMAHMDLSEHEKKMLEEFQKLSEADQEFVLGFIEKIKKE